jgi:hypothetical protein
MRYSPHACPAAKRDDYIVVLVSRTDLLGVPPGDDLMRVEDLRSLSLFDGLGEGQLGELAGAASEVRIGPGVDLFHEGEYADFWWVLLDGVIDLIRHVGREDRVVGTMDAPGPGPAVSGSGMSTASISQPAEEWPRGGCSECQPKCCVSGPPPGSRLADTSWPGCIVPHAASNRRRGTANPSWPSAASPPALPTRSTIRRLPPPRGQRP